MFICVLLIKNESYPPCSKSKIFPLTKGMVYVRSEVGPLFSEPTMNLNTLYKKLTGEQFSLVCEALGKFNK